MFLYTDEFCFQDDSLSSHVSLDTHPPYAKLWYYRARLWYMWNLEHVGSLRKYNMHLVKYQISSYKIVANCCSDRVFWSQWRTPTHHSSLEYRKRPFFFASLHYEVDENVILPLRRYHVMTTKTSYIDDHYHIRYCIPNKVVAVRFGLWSPISSRDV